MHGERPAARLLSTVQDVTEPRRAQERLSQSQRLEAIGRLAGGIAHDFNNLLTAIIGQTEFALQALDPQAPAGEHLRPVLDSAERAATLTHQLLAFARRQVTQPRVLSANDAVRGLSDLLRRLLGENIQINTHLADDLGNIKVDPGHYEQILVNLATNARDAMPDGGTLTIETANAALDEEYVRQHPGAAPGEYVLLAVSDTGVGMDPGVRRHIFEPFFTTKREGRGTGLGLATCHGIVAQGGGHLWVYSEPGHGTTFKIYFPRVAEPTAAPAASLPPTAVHGSESILVVEDETAILDVMVRALRANGYTVRAAATGTDALAAVRVRGAAIDLMVTDVVLPDMNGRQLAARLAEAYPQAQALFVSGYTDNVLTHRGVLDPGVAFLQKPFTLNALLHRVRECLDHQTA